MIRRPIFFGLEIGSVSGYNARTSNREIEFLNKVPRRGGGGRREEGGQGGAAAAGERSKHSVVDLIRRKWGEQT